MDYKKGSKEEIATHFLAFPEVSYVYTNTYGLGMD